MRFTVPFLLAIAVYVATVLGANQTSFTPNEDMLYDVVSASDAIGFRLERALGLSEQLALMLGAVLLTLPALATFHLFRIGFGGSIQSLIHEERLNRQLQTEREKFATARYEKAGAVPSLQAKDGEVLARSRAGDNAREANAESSSSKDQRPHRGPNERKERRRGLGANIAAALKGKGRKSGSTTQTDVASDAATETKPASSGESSGLKDRWGGLLDTKPDFSRLKNGAQNLREKVAPRSGTTKLSLDDISEEVADKSN